MASDIKNVKLGVCKVLFGGVDLGYTKGGVEVSAQTETHEVTVDQFGKTVINEYVMGRTIKVKAPLAETTLSNLVAIMPGATMVQFGGAKATGTITVATNPTNGQTITVNGVTITFKTGGAVVGNNEVLIGATAGATATNLGLLFTSSPTFALSGTFDATVATSTVTLTNKQKGVAGNSLTMATGTAGASVTFVAFAGGADGTPARVDVPSGVGANLLDYAKELVLHPVGRPDADKSEDFTVFRAATAGGLDFAYKLEDERIFSVEFGGYPDATGRIFAIGDTTAV